MSSPGLILSGNQVNTSHVFAEAKKLFQLKLFRSVENLCLLCASHITKSDSISLAKSTTKVISVPLPEIYELLGDAIYEQRHVKRAWTYYRLAIQHKPPIGVKVAQVNRISKWISSASDASLAFKLSKCHYEMGETTVAIHELESIPTTFRDVSMRVTLGEWYQATNRIEDALKEYKEAYAQAPYAIEILEIMSSLKTDEVEVLKMLKNYHHSQHQEEIMSSAATTSESSNPSNNSIARIPTTIISRNPPDWMQYIIIGLHRHYRYETEKALENFQRLLPIFPKNVFALRLAAQAWTFHEVEEQAMTLYRQILRLDETYVQGMDRYASLLQRHIAKQGALTREDEALKRLATGLMDSSQAMAPEALTAVAYYCLVKKDFESALSFTERALSVSKNAHAEAYRCRGVIYSDVGLNIASSALAYYIRANALEKDIASFVGLIEMNIELKQYRDAATAGKEMVLLYPKSARALYTLGTIMSKSPQGARETVKAYSKALRLNPRLLDATLALCGVYLALGNNEEAENCAKEALSNETNPAVLIYLGKALSNQGRYSEALDKFRLSLSLSSVQSTPVAAAIAEEASQEIDRIETVLKDENGAQLQQEQMLMDGDAEEEEEVEEDELAQDYAYVQEAEEEEEDVEDDDSGMNMGVRRGRLFGEQDDDDDI